MTFNERIGVLVERDRENLDWYEAGRIDRHEFLRRRAYLRARMEALLAGDES